MNSLFERLIAARRLSNREIRREGSRKLPDQTRLSRLKKERLATKDCFCSPCPA
ncbi:YdcH family protein [Phenylobacterium sp. J367]|uniref:YdcH family protein n=1 Tax=Phenylobacterium sp. J367 TaxID=2898435 RepID=UPI0035AF3F62